MAPMRPASARSRGNRREPVVAVGQHHYLPVIPRLEEFLGAAMHETDACGAALDYPICHG